MVVAVGLMKFNAFASAAGIQGESLGNKTYQADHLHVIPCRILMAAGTRRHIADNVAEILINSNLAGHDSHDLLVLSERLDQITSETVDATAEPLVVKETGATLMLDGNGGFGLHPARAAMDGAARRRRYRTSAASNSET